MSKTDMPILEQRRIEANIIKPIYEEMVAQLGAERAKEILGAAITKNAIGAGRGLCRSAGRADIAARFPLSVAAMDRQWRA